MEALRFDDLAITCGMNVFSNCIKNQFAHSFAQFAMLTSISGDENEITLGFKQRSNVRDVTGLAKISLFSYLITIWLSVC